MFAQTHLIPALFVVGSVLGVAPSVCASATLTDSGVPAALQATISPEQAAVLALNSVSVTTDGLSIAHRDHMITFDSSGVRVTPNRGPQWTWSLTNVEGNGGTALGREVGSTRTGSARDADNGADGSGEAVLPERTGLTEIAYERGPVDEVYVLGTYGVEQRFLIEAPLWSRAAGSTGSRIERSEDDLVIEGRVECDGTLHRTSDGWAWRNDDGEVTLGDVYVYGADGRALGAAMSVSGTSTRIVISGEDLASAAYPVTVDPEIGTNDFRVSDMGTDGDFNWDAQECAVAYNATNNQYLVVWAGDDNTGTLVDGEFEIFGQRIDAASGAALGTNDFRISDMGANGDGTADALSPAVAWNSSINEYLVVWAGDDATGGLVDGETEIFGQRLAGATGAELGTNDFRISDMGADGDALFDAADPAVAFNSTNNEYLVVWTGDDVTNEESEIFGQRLAGSTGVSVGTNDFRISDMGTDGDPLFDALAPAVVYAAPRGEYLVVWEGDDNSGTLVNGEFEIYGQRITASTGAQIGTNDFRISDMGPDGSSAYDAQEPDVAYAAAENRYLVVWSADDNLGGVVEGEREIYGQLLDATTGGQVGTNDFRITDMGPDGDPLFDATAPAVGYNPDAGEFLVVWEGDDKGGGLDDGEFEIFGQIIDAATGAEVGTNDFVLTDVGTPGLTTVGATRPDVAVRTNGSFEFLVAWDADTDLNGLAEGEHEVYGQRLRDDGNEIGTNDFRMSDMGVDGDIDWDARQPDVAYNPDANEYLVVWEGDDNVGTLVDGETEIFGQRIDATTGTEVGTNDFRISDAGPDGDPAWDAQKPVVVYNRVSHEYLVVWSGEDNVGALVAGEFEIFGQRLDGATGAEIGTNDFRISDMGTDGNALFAGLNPSVAFNATNNEYLVVWQGDDAIEGEFEIYGQRIAGGTGAAVGTNDFRLSDMGPNGIADYSAVLPAAAWNSVQNEFLVVWAGEDNAGVLVAGEFEIYGQRLTNTGAEVGTNDFRISTAGNDGDDTYDAFNPAIAYNSTADEYLVVWDGEDIGAQLAPGEKEIFGQRLSSAGVQVGVDDFRISDMGPNLSSLYDAQAPSVSYNVSADEYLVVWEGDDDTAPYVNGETEIWAQRLVGATGAEVGDNDFRLSDMGVDGDPLSDATDPKVSAAGGDLMIVLWRGDDDNGVFGADEFEIFGQMFSFGVGTSSVGDLVAHADFGITVSPNPVSRYGRIEFSAPVGAPVELTLIDVAGRVHWSEVASANGDGVGSIEFDASGLSRGAYFVRAATGGSVNSRKVVIAN
ncbi:MAG: T9SS type A sorting domain-containing protein [Candidatus Eisenbacteria bacterium]